jgi:hypothetical protein
LTANVTTIEVYREEPSIGKVVLSGSRKTQGSTLDQRRRD